MRGDRRLIHLVRRPLNGRVVVDLVLLGDDDDAARMLSRGDLDVHAALGQALQLGVSVVQTLALHVMIHILKGGLFRNTGDRSRSEGVSLAEHDLHVLVRLRLVLA